MQGFELFLGEEFLGRFLGLPVDSDIGPVSYTHLDVYKRQVDDG